MWLILALIGNAVWSVSDIANSIIVHHFEKNAVVVTWLHSAIALLVLFLLLLFIPLQVGWLGWFAAAGFSAYLGFLVLVYVLERVDVSVMNAAWVFMSIGIALGGFVLFGDRWTLMQTIGVALSMGGVLFLSFWHSHVSLGKTVTMFAVLGLLYSPFFLVIKAAMNDGMSVFSAFFWPVFFEYLSGCFLPVLHAPSRASIYNLVSKSIHPGLLLLCSVSAVGSLLGWIFMVASYQLQMVSIVGVVENLQPFTTILFAWIVSLLIPKYAPKELITVQSIGVKLFSFSLVFIGLGLLAT